MSLREDVLKVAEGMDMLHCCLSGDRAILTALGRFADELRRLVREDCSRYREVPSPSTTEGPRRHHGVAEAWGGPLDGEWVAFDFQGQTGTLAGHLYAVGPDHKLHWLGQDLTVPKPDTVVQEQDDGA